MKRLLFASLALAAVLVGTATASAAPVGFHYLRQREQARWEVSRRPAPRPAHSRPVPPPRALPLVPHHEQPHCATHRR